VAPESVGRNLQALPLSQSPRRRTRYALGDPSTAEGEPYYVAEHRSPQPRDGDVTHVRILTEHECLAPARDTYPVATNGTGTLQRAASDGCKGRGQQLMFYRKRERDSPSRLEGRECPELC
jgi:hypothetical protein